MRSWIKVGAVVRRADFGGVHYRIEVIDLDRITPRAKLSEFTDGMPSAMWVSCETLATKWEPAE